MIDSFGTIMYSKVYGGSSEDAFVRIIHTQNGGYLALGNFRSDDGSLPNNSGEYDGRAFRFSSSLDSIWSNNYGMVANSDEKLVDAVAIDKGDILMAGITDFSKKERFGNSDFWLLRTNSLGEQYLIFRTYQLPTLALII